MYNIALNSILHITLYHINKDINFLISINKDVNHYKIKHKYSLLKSKMQYTKYNNWFY